MKITRQDVAKRAGTSGTTVSFVLGGSWRERGIAAATAERVERAADELGYVPDHAARSLRGGSTGRVALVLRGYGRPFHGQLVEAFNRALNEQGRRLMVLFRNLLSERHDTVVEALGQADAVVVWQGQPSPATQRRIRASGKVVVFAEEAKVRGFPSLVIDSGEAVRQAVFHMLDAGCREVWFAGGGQQRIDAWEAALRARRCGPRSGWLLDSVADYADGERVAERLQIDADKRIGIIAGNDAAALGMIHTLSTRRLVASRHYLIIGFDDLEAGRYLPRPLSTVAFDYDLAAQLCLKMIDKPKNGAARRPLPMAVIERATTRWR